MSEQQALKVLVHLVGVPELSYENLDGVQDGGAAMNAYQEAINPETSAPRKAEIEKQLLAYCRLDTFAMVRLWQYFSGRIVGAASASRCHFSY
jgi:hypothetical protein